MLLLLFASIDALKDTEVIIISLPGLKNMIRRFELTGDLGIAPGEADGQLRQKLLKKWLLPWLRMLDAMCDLHDSPKSNSQITS